MNGDEIVSPRAEGERVGEKGTKAGRHQGTKARRVKPRPVVARGGKERVRVHKPQASSLKPSSPASAEPQMHSWRDCKRSAGGGARTEPLISARWISSPSGWY